MPFYIFFGDDIQALVSIVNFSFMCLCAACKLLNNVYVYYPQIHNIMTDFYLMSLL